jgi:hypothetical protein
MSHIQRSILVGALLLGVTPATAYAATCESLSSFKLRNAVVTGDLSGKGTRQRGYVDAGGNHRAATSRSGGRFVPGRLLES